MALLAGGRGRSSACARQELVGGAVGDRQARAAHAVADGRGREDLVLARDVAGRDVLRLE